MNVYASNLGYRELDRLADFMKKVAEHGLYDDVPVSFSYNWRDDEGYCTTENGEMISMTDLDND